MTEYTYAVTLGASTDISADVETITVTETGTGEICSAVVRLQSLDGKFVTTAGGNVIDEFDKIKISITDDSSNTFTKTYEVDNIVPVESAQEGNVVDIECLGFEHHLQKFFFAKQFYFDSAFNVVKDAIDQYNANNATLQPEIQGHDVATFNDGTVTHDTNELPLWTSNLYDFNIAEKKVYDGCIDVAERLGSTVANGGANDFFEIYFTKHSTDDTKLIFQGFISGSNPTAGNEITITDTDAVNGDPTEGGLGSTPATVIASWGADEFGSQPVDTAQFAGELEAFNLDPEWKSANTPYPQNARVQLTGKHYTSNINNNSSTPATNWTEKFARDFIGASSEYSPWTNNKAAQFKNSGSHPDTSETGFKLQGQWDSNLVVWDNSHYRTNVVQRVNTDVVGATLGQIASQYLYSTTTPYRGFRVLVDPNIAAIAGVFATNGGLDRFGVAYSKNVVQHNGGQVGDFNDWDVFRVTSDNEEVEVTHEGITYQRNTGTWTDISATSRANDAFHTYTSIGTTAGVNSTIKSTGPTVTYGDTSAVEVQYDYSTFNIFTDLVLTDVDYYRMGAWLNLRFPYPFSTFNSVGTLGALWGNNTTIFEPATYDTNNMHLTHSGQTGFNVTEASEHGPNSSLNFAMRLIWTGKTTGTQLLAGNFKMRCAMYDTSDNVVVQDFVISHNGLFQDISLPLDSFQIYRARTPFRRTLDGTDPVFLLDDLDVVNRFEWKNIKMICFQWQEPYNDEGQFLPEGSRVYRDVVAGELGGRIRLAIDRLHWGKPLLAVTSPVTTGRALMPEFLQVPLISNEKQLRQHNESWLEVAKFRHKQYDIKTEGKIDINFGDTFFLQKNDLVDDADTRTADTGGTTSNIRLVAKKIIYKISKSSAEGSHFVRYITGIKRILS